MCESAVVLTQAEWITSLPLNKALLLLFTMNKGSETCAKAYLHIHANALVHNNLIRVKRPFDAIAHVCKLCFCYHHDLIGQDPHT